MENFKRLIINKINNFLCLFYSTKNKIEPNNLKEALILPPAEFGSLGDEAMIMSVIEYLNQNHNINSDLISLSLLMAYGS